MKLARLVVSLVLYRKLDMDPICLVPTPINTVYMAKHALYAHPPRGTRTYLTLKRYDDLELSP